MKKKNLLGYDNPALIFFEDLCQTLRPTLRWFRLGSPSEGVPARRQDSNLRFGYL